MFGGGFVLPYLWFALGVGLGRYVWRRFRIILSLVRVRCWFRTLCWRLFVLSYRGLALGVGFRSYKENIRLLSFLSPTRRRNDDAVFHRAQFYDLKTKPEIRI